MKRGVSEKEMRGCLRKGEREMVAWALENARQALKRAQWQYVAALAEAKRLKVPLNKPYEETTA